MLQLVNDGSRLVLSSTGDGAAVRRRFNPQALSPILIGLVAPLLVISLLAPASIRESRTFIYIVLLCLFCVAVALFAYAALNPGRIASVVCDRAARTVEIVWLGAISATSVRVPFEDVRTLRVRTDYDDDGYPMQVAELVLRSNEVYGLPAGVSEAQLAHMRRAIGLA